MIRIAIIGGGSYTWSPAFLRDLFGATELSGSTVVLHDIDAARLARVFALGQKMLRDFGLPFRLEQTLALEAALQEADFVVLTITTGRFQAMRPDLEIPARYGIRQPVGDTTGPGGLARALRNIPVLAEIGRQVMKTCPEALFLNYTNPLSALTRTLAQEGVKVVGLCHEWLGVRAKLATIFRVEPQQIESSLAGINHLPWVTGLWAAGRDVWPELPGIAEKILAGEILLDADDDSVFADHARVKARLFQIYEALPVAGDRHVSEFFSQFIQPSTAWGADYGIRLTGIADRLALEAAAENLIDAALRDAVPLAPFMAERSGEALVEIITAVVTGGCYTGVVNLPNTGQVANLPRAAVVESGGVIDAAGPRPAQPVCLPPGVQAVVERHIRNQELAIQAARLGDRSLALQALFNDPLSSRLSEEQSARMLSELLEANRPYLPLFFT